MKSCNVSGFTLIELLVAITVLAVLLAIGVPSFTETIRSNELASQTNDLVAALNYARSESLKRAEQITVCPRNSAGTACSGGTDWNTGILAFRDHTGTTGAVDGSDEILQLWAAYNAGLTATGPAAITFERNGVAAATTFEIYKTGCVGTKKRRITVQMTGRVGLAKEAC